MAFVTETKFGWLWMMAFSLSFLPMEVIGSRINRVVFQTFILSDGATVQCYGQCDKDLEDLTGQLGKFNVTRCEGRKVRLRCPIGFVIKIHIASLGRSNPELEVCNQNKQLSCLKDIASKLQNGCKHKRQCTIEVKNSELKDICGVVKFISLDVKYTCEIPPTKIFTLTKKKRDPTVIPTLAVEEALISTKEMHTSPIITTKPFYTEPRAGKPALIAAKSNTQEKSSFLIMSAYTLLSDSEFIRNNTTHMMLAVGLSVFIGLVLSMCFILDHCRRKKLKKAKKKLKLELSQTEDNELLENGRRYSGDNIITERRSNIGMALIKNESVPKDKNSHYKVKSTQNNNNNHILYNLKQDEERLLPNTIETVKPKINLQNKHIVTCDHIELNNFRIQSPSSLPPPPEEFLETSPSSSSNDFIPPPPQFNEGKKIVPRLIITSPTPTTTSSQSNVNGTIEQVPVSKPGAHVKPILTRSQSHGSSACIDISPAPGYPGSVKVCRTFDHDTNSNSVKLARKFSFNDSDKHVINKSRNVKFAVKRNSMSSETLHTLKSMYQDRNQAFKPIGTIKNKSSNAEESPLFQTNKRINFISTNTPPPLRNPRKGRVHVIQPSHTDTTKNSLYNRESTNSVVNLSTHSCGSGHNHACICVPSCGPSGGLVCSCTKIKDRCCLRENELRETQKLCESHRSKSTDFAPSSRAGFEQRQPHCQRLLSLSDMKVMEKRLERRSLIVEESGYHSHETGTDSMCSSMQSTDQEDFHVFSPASSSSSKEFGRRTKVCRVRDRNQKKDQKLISISTSSGKAPLKPLRSSQYDCHISSDARPSESSLDGGSSRDSVRVVTRCKPKSRTRVSIAETKKSIIESDTESENNGGCHFNTKGGILQNGESKLDL